MATKSELSDLDVVSEMSTIYDNYIIDPADKAANNEEHTVIELWKILPSKYRFTETS